MSHVQMDEGAVESLMSTVDLLNSSLDTVPTAWQAQLQAVRSITSSLDLLDTAPDPRRRRWQIPLITVFQRVAFADADNAIVQDVADWCLRQSLTLLHLYAQDVDIIACKLFIQSYTAS